MKRLLCSTIFLVLFMLSGNLFSQEYKDLLKYINFDLIYANPDLGGDSLLLLYDKSPFGHPAGYFYGKKSQYSLSTGIAGSAVQFDSTGLALSTDKSVAANLNKTVYYDSILTSIPREQLTIAAWVKCDKPIAPGYQQIIGWGAGSGINMYIKNGKLQLETESLPDYDVWGFYPDNTTLNLNTNWTYGTNWTHVAAVFNKGFLQLIVNGQLMASDTVKGYADSADFKNNKLTVVSAMRSIDGEGWSLAASFGWKPYDRGLTSGYNKFSNFFFGSIDELRIYNTALDTNQIQLLPEVRPLMVRYYDFDSIQTPDSLLLFNKSPYKHDLVLLSGAKNTYSQVTGKIGKALYFDGVANGLALTIPAGNARNDHGNANYYDEIFNDMQHREFTIASWIKVEKPIASGFQHIVGWGSGSGINLYIRNANLYCDIQVYPREDTWGFFSKGTLTSLKKKWSYGTGWNHIAAVFNNGRIDLRINGTLVATDSVRSYLDLADFYSNKQTVIPNISSIDGQGWSVGGAFGWKPYDHAAGSDVSGWNRFSWFFKGAIDEMRFYTYALDSTEICGLPGSPCPQTGIAKTIAEPVLQVYPNPTADVIHIRINNIDGNSTASVYNAIGVLVNRYQLKDALISISLKDYNNGIYFIQVNDGGTISTQKFIVRK